MQFWLMKSEPSTYGILNLKEKGVDMWEGCRNYQVRNLLRDEVKIGDQCVFYHSNADPSGLAGLMEVVGEGYPDPTQFDPTSKYYDPKSNPENPRWVAVDVKFVRAFNRIVPLAELKAHPLLSGMEVCKKGQRMSVLRVKPDEWNAILSLPGI